LALGKGTAMDDGGYELFGVGSVCGIYVFRAPYFNDLLFQ
jgi:hypothetical protein